MASKPLELCAELRMSNRRTNDAGVEIAKILPNGKYVVNYLEAYDFIVNASIDPSRPVTNGVMYREFGVKGTWGVDFQVELMLVDLEDIGFIERNDKGIFPKKGMLGAKKILKDLSYTYTPLTETLAGLHELEENH